jgi:hypothetical protein
LFGLFVLSLSGIASQQTTDETIPIDDTCPPSDDSDEKDGDGNGDEVDDWKLHEQTDADGNKVELWCIDPNGVKGDGSEENPYDEYYALVYVDAQTGERKFIGKCPYEGGRNSGKKTHQDGVIVKVWWRSVDKGLIDDDGDGIEDDAIYEYHPPSDEFIKKHSENGVIVDERTQETETFPFDFGDLPPRNPSEDDFWTLNVGEHLGIGEPSMPDEEVYPVEPVEPVEPIESEEPISGTLLRVTEESEDNDGLCLGTLVLVLFLLGGVTVYLKRR